jgi:Cys-rich repeat protein
MGCGGLEGYYCHTPQDECVNDSDCGAGKVCTYAASQSRWTCQAQLLCG